jgi:hypothetical protein
LRDTIHKFKNICNMFLTTLIKLELTLTRTAQMQIDTSCNIQQAIKQGILHVASGGDQYFAMLRKLRIDDHRPPLLHWHASIAKNTAAEFAISEELVKGSDIRDILLCNLDGDNIMLRTFPTACVEKAGCFTILYKIAYSCGFFFCIVV